jgi:spoIIIJ-associated protein
MPIDDLQQAARKIAEFLNTLNKLGGIRLKYRISAGDGTPDADGGATPQLNVELAGPDVPLVIQRNGELLRALETLAAQMLRLDHHEHNLVSFDAGNFKALRDQELRNRRGKGPPVGNPLQFSAHEQPRAAPVALDLPVARWR